MLSTEKHPTDPSCLGDDERPYDKLNAVVDLSTSDLEKGPKFSIRDYVFFTRNKNVVNNWPFSENNMQLCLKHGVKDLLPPFQSPDLVRNQPRAQGNVESVVVDKENSCDSIGEPSDSNNHFELVKSSQSGCDPNLFVKSTSVNPSVSEADKEHRSTTTCQTASKKLAVKKCRLIMKYSNIPHSSTKETTTVNAPMSSEAVAVCPVCRTFSSLSNTTLNAHIDQCLSGEYTAKAASDSKANRQRRKPRKIKLMVDIYKTAPHCTLEELDRRNGSNWASNRTFPPPEVEKISADPKGLCLNAKETNGDGSVYVDSNGTKLLILSKFSNPTDSKVVATPQPRKLLKGGERSMSLLAKKIKKMRNQIKKQQKRLRLANHGKKISNGQDGIVSHEKIVEKDECMVKQHKLTETTKGWVRSEKTDVKEKINSAADDKRHSRECMDGNLLAKRGLSSLTNSQVKKLSDLKYPNANRAGKIGQNDNSSHEVHDESRGNPGKCHGRKRSLVLHELSEHGVNDNRQNGSSYHEENAPSLDKRPFKIRKTHARNDDNSVSNPKSSSSHHALLPKTKKFSSLSKKLSWASHAAAPDSRFSPKRKFSSIKKKVFNASDEETPSHSGTDQSQDFSHEVTEEDSKWGDTSSEEEPYDRNVVLKVRSSGQSIISREKEAIALKSSQSTSMHSHHDPDSWNENVLMLGSVARHTSDNVEQLSEVAVGGQFTRFSNSAEAGYLSLPGRFIEEYKLPLYEAEVATNLTEPVLTSGQDIFGANLIPDALRIENVCMMVDQIPIPGPPGSFLPSPRHMDSDDLQGHSSLTSTRVQSHDDHHDFADQSSESHASDTSTVSNTNIRRSASEPSEKLSVVPPSSDVDIARSTIVANVMETTCPPKTKLNNASTDMPSPNHPCCCSRKEVLLKNVGLNYQDSPLLQRRTMGETQTRCGPNGTLDSSNSSFSLRLAVQIEDGTKSVSGIVSSSVYNNDKEEPFSPAPSTPVLRLMGKNLMVMNKDENDKLFDLKHSVSNSAIGHANLQAVYTDNEERHTAPRMTFQDPRFFHRAETYGAGLHHSDETLSKVVGNYAHSDSTPQANAADYIAKAAAASYYTPQVTGFGRDGAVCISGMSKSDPRNTSPCYETQDCVYGRPVRSLVDSSGLVHHRPNGANNELVKWNLSLENQEYVYGRPVRSLVESSGLVQHHPNGANNEPVKWNCTLETQEYAYGRPVRSLVDSSGLVQHPNGAKQ